MNFQKILEQIDFKLIQLLINFLQQQQQKITKYPQTLLEL